MALKSFHSETLNDNWFEERSAPLNRVLPNDSKLPNDYITINSRDYKGAVLPECNLCPRMVNSINIDQALLQELQVDSYAKSKGFRALLPQTMTTKIKGDKTLQLINSTPRERFVNHFPKQEQVKGVPTMCTAEIRDMNAAGGPSCRLQDRGKHTSGAAGELFKKHNDPAKDTQSQRAWLYSKDPMFQVIEEREKVQSQTALSPENIEKGGALSNYRRKSSSITKGPNCKITTTFVDDE